MAASRLMRIAPGLAFVGALLTFAGAAAASDEGREHDDASDEGRARAPADGATTRSTELEGSAHLGPPDPGNPCRPQC